MNSFALKVFLAGWLTAAMSLAGSAVLGQEAKKKKPDPTLGHVATEVAGRLEGLAKGTETK